MKRIKITDPGTLLSVLVDREIHDGLAEAIIEMIRADDVIADGDYDAPEGAGEDVEAFRG